MTTSDNTPTPYEFDGKITQRELFALEASAGTGKTWTIENLVPAHLADGTVAPDELVIVTFTRAATAELRARVRQKIAEIARGAGDDSDARRYSDAEREVLRRVLGNFGRIRISTIHGFAQRALSLLGEPLGQMDASVDAESFRQSVLRDVIRGLDPSTLAALTSIENFESAITSILTQASFNPSGILFASQPDASKVLLMGVARQVQQAVEERKNYLGVSGYNDLLVRLEQRLRNPHDAELVAQSIKVLMIDEFQDTDSLQWRIFQAIAQRGHLEVFAVVGDPKQAIYGFRGGDIQVYREAVAPGSARFLVNNFRSTGSFVEAANEFFRGHNFGFRFETPTGALPVGDDFECLPVAITYEEVTAANEKLKDIADGPGWFFRRAEGTAAPAIRKSITADLPGYIGALVRDEMIPDPTTGELRRVNFDDICILAPSNPDVKNYTEILHEHNIPATILGGGNVFASEAALQWRLLLEAIDQPSRLSSARLLAWSWFGGQSLSTLAERLTDENWLSNWHNLLFKWRDVFAKGDRFTFYDTVIRESQVLTYLSGITNAERHITDVRHLAEILSQRRTDTIDQLVELLIETNANARNDEDGGTDEVADQWTRRIDGDRSAVRVMTIHQSKGLQFPIVLVPYMTDHLNLQNTVVAYRVASPGEVRTVIDVTASGSAPGKDVKSELVRSELERQAYVAFTRGQVRNVLWTWDNKKSAPIIQNHEWRAARADEGRWFAWDDRDGAAVPVAPLDVTGLGLATRTATLGVPPFRGSYSGITKNLSATANSTTIADSEPEDSEGFSADTPDVESDQYAHVRSSALLGKVVHRVLQTIDLTEVVTREAIESLVHESADEFGLALDGDPDHPATVPTMFLVEMVERSLASQLGDIAPGITLAQFAGRQRLPELGFDFTLRQAVSVSDVMNVLRRHLTDDPAFASWLASVNVTVDNELAGFFTGSIDAVLADVSRDEPRFFVVDYKSNQLGDDGATIYDSGRMAPAMVHHHYQLQGVIYLVALHRYLRSRLGAGYDYDRHIAGAAYLFLRGMHPGHPGSGVFALRPPKECVEELSELFDGGPR